MDMDYSENKDKQLVKRRKLPEYSLHEIKKKIRVGDGSDVEWIEEDQVSLQSGTCDSHDETDSLLLEAVVEIPRVDEYKPKRGGRGRGRGRGYKRAASLAVKNSYMSTPNNNSYISDSSMLAALAGNDTSRCNNCQAYIQEIAALNQEIKSKRAVVQQWDKMIEDRDERYQSKLDYYKSDLKSLNKRIDQLQLSEEFFKDKRCRVTMYTGFPSYTTLMTIYNLVVAAVPKDNHVYKITHFQKYILCLMRLRMNLKFKDLANRFHVDLCKIERFFPEWIDAIHKQLSHTLLWPANDVDQRLALLGQSLKDHYKVIKEIVPVTKIISSEGTIRRNHKIEITCASLKYVSQLSLSELPEKFTYILLDKENTVDTYLKLIGKYSPPSTPTDEPPKSELKEDIKLFVKTETNEQVIKNDAMKSSPSNESRNVSEVSSENQSEPVDVSNMKFECSSTPNTSEIINDSLDPPDLLEGKIDSTINSDTSDKKISTKECADDRTAENVEQTVSVDIQPEIDEVGQLMGTNEKSPETNVCEENDSENGSHNEVAPIDHKQNDEHKSDIATVATEVQQDNASSDNLVVAVTLPSSITEEASSDAVVATESSVPVCDVTYCDTLPMETDEPCATEVLGGTTSDKTEALKESASEALLSETVADTTENIIEPVPSLLPTSSAEETPIVIAVSSFLNNLTSCAPSTMSAVNLLSSTEPLPTSVASAIETNELVFNGTDVPSVAADLLSELMSSANDNEGSNAASVTEEFLSVATALAANVEENTKPVASSTIDSSDQQDSSMASTTTDEQTDDVGTAKKLEELHLQCQSVHEELIDHVDLLVERLPYNTQLTRFYQFHELINNGTSQRMVSFSVSDQTIPLGLQCWLSLTKLTLGLESADLAYCYGINVNHVESAFEDWIKVWLLEISQQGFSETRPSEELLSKQFAILKRLPENKMTDYVRICRYIHAKSKGTERNKMELIYSPSFSDVWGSVGPLQSASQLHSMLTEELKKIFVISQRRLQLFEELLENGTDSFVLFYTGFPDYDSLYDVFKVLAPGPKLGRDKAGDLSLFSQFMCVLLRLVTDMSKEEVLLRVCREPSLAEDTMEELVNRPVVDVDAIMSAWLTWIHSKLMLFVTWPVVHRDGQEFLRQLRLKYRSACFYVFINVFTLTLYILF